MAVEEKTNAKPQLDTTARYVWPAYSKVHSAGGTKLMSEGMFGGAFGKPVFDMFRTPPIVQPGMRLKDPTAPYGQPAQAGQPIQRFIQQPSPVMRRGAGGMSPADQDIARQMVQSQPKKKGGMFSGGGKGWDALAMISGTLRDLDGTMGRQNYAQALQGIQGRRAQDEAKAKQAQQQAAMEQMLQGMTPEQRMAYQANPEAFSNAYVDNLFRERKPIVVGESSRLADDEGNVILDAAPKMPQDSFSVLTDDQEKQMGLDPAGTYQQNRLTGKIAPLGGGGQTINVNNNPSAPFGQDGGDLPIGGGTKGKEEAIVRGFDGKPIVVPGSKAQLYNKTKNSIEDLSFQNDLIVEDISRALQLADTAFTTGFTGSIAKGVPGTPAFDLAKVLDGIKANVGFDKLQNMRDNSPTGGALGQVSEWELVLLQSVLGSLEQSQTKEQFVYNLDRLQKVKAEGDRRRRSAFEQDFPALRDYKEFAFEADQERRQAPQGAVEMLRGDPSLKEAFDQKYGKGAADKALGGQ